MSDMTHLDELEAEAIYIMREVVAECEKPVMLYSIGKDSSVMLHLALKAFYPEKPPFPFLHVNTTWKFKEMIEFRDKIAEKYGLDMIEYINEDGVKKGINPFDHGSSYTDIMKTQALKQALLLHLAVEDVMRRNPEQRREFSLSVIPAMRGILKISVRRCGSFTIQIFIRAKKCVYFLFLTGRRKISGSTFSVKILILFRCTLQQRDHLSEEMAISLW